jgi:hypothetical protein
MFYFRREVTRSLLTRRNLPSIINGQHQIFAFQDREHLPFLCLHQPATQIFFRTSRLQSEIFAPIQRKSMLAPVKKFAISRENQTFCADDCLGCGMLSSLAVFRRKAKRNCNMHMFSKPWSGEYGEMYIGCWIFYGSGAKTSRRCLGSETEQWGYNSLNEVANPSILFVILHCLSAKRNVLIHDTMIGRCNGILIVPMCLRILL